MPAIIRNAEHLGLLKDILQQADDEDQIGPGVMITEAITLIVAGRRDDPAPGQVAPAMLPPPPPPMPPAKRGEAGAGLSRRSANARDRRPGRQRYGIDGRVVPTAMRESYSTGRRPDVRAKGRL